jgi:diaminohydroxyphosphoribosylaminopyrimidine deaminase / 5-amino-6-(5-phosphoribosylamino)uracil reductase
VRSLHDPNCPSVPTHTSDDEFLLRALELARKGLGLASPNPHVGAVIVDCRGTIAGSGTYTYDGVKHAEVLALQEAGSRAKGGTLYINLEPHAHQGRTPPCTDALIAAGIHRVAACMPDPNPKVSGLGFEKLRAAGIEVEVGKFQREAQRLNDGFTRYIRHGIPLVTLKAAMTLDGKIAPSLAAQARQSTGKEFTGTWITGASARTHAHELRHQHDAILTGIGTVLADNPLLTDRSGHPRRRPLLRVILDSHLRLPVESRIVQSIATGRASENDALVFYSAADTNKRLPLEQHGVRIECVASGTDGKLDMTAVLRRLGELEITSAMIEGGSRINGAALGSGVVDKIFFYYAPTILGSGSVPFAAGDGFSMGAGATRVKSLQLHRLGEDIAVEGYLRDPYQE